MSRPQNPSEGDRDWPPEQWQTGQPQSGGADPPAFGGYPAGGAQQWGYQPDRPPPAARPGVLVVSAIAWILDALVLGFFGLGFLVAAGAQQPQLRDTLADSGLPADAVDTVVGVLPVLGGGFLILGAAVLVLAILLLVVRAQWVRITLAVVGAVAVIAGVMALFVPSLLAVAGLVLQFLPTVNRWFRAAPGGGGGR